MAANWDLCTDCVAAGKHCLVPDHKLDLVQYNAVYTARTRVYLKDSGLKTFLLSPEILDTDAKAFAINGETQSSVIETDELTFTLYRSDVFPPAASACALAIPKVAVDDTYRFPDGMAYDWKDGAWTTQLDWLNLDRDVERGINFGSLAVSFLARSGGWSKPESVVDSGLGKWRDLFAMSRFDGRFVLDLVVAVKK